MPSSPLHFSTASIVTMVEKDLVVAFFDDAPNPRQLMLHRTPSHERLLPVEDRGARCTIGEEEIGFVAEAAWTSQGVRLVMGNGSVMEIDTTGAGAASVDRARLVTELMNFDQQFTLTGVDAHDEARIELFLDRLMSEDPQTVRDALRQAHASRELLADALLELVDDSLTPEFVEDSNLPPLAFYLLASWGEARGLEPLVTFLERGGAEAEEALGDVVTEDVPLMLVAMAHRDFSVVRRLIENTQAGVWSRIAGIDALVTAAAHGRIAVDEVEAYLESVIERGVAGSEEVIWTELSCAAADLGSSRLLPLIEKAWDEGRIDEQVMGRDEWRGYVARGRESMLEEQRRLHPLSKIDDPVAATSWWSFFHPETESRGILNEDDPPWRPVETIRLSPKVGRNEPCPCGSGKKFKKCCGA